MVSRRVCVLGAGIIGLSSAVSILETCHDVEVTIVAEKFSPHTTSDVAGGLWEPFCLGETPQHLISNWSGITWNHLSRLFSSPEAGKVGCQLLSGCVYSKQYQDDFWFKDKVLGYRHMSERELNLYPLARWGVFFTTYQIDVTLYLHWLMSRFKDKGGKIKQRKVESIDEVVEHYDVVVNCTGAGSYHLLGDTEVCPIRGQVFRFKAPWLKHFIAQLEPEGRETYIIPGSRNVIVGGITQRGNWNTDVDEADSKDIHQRALSLMPNLKNAEIVANNAGLRPGRTTVRLERENVRSGNKMTPVIHNYGHGGGGITLHWGCAHDVTKLVEEALTRSKL